LSLTFVYVHSSPDILKNNCKEKDEPRIRRTLEDIEISLKAEISDLCSYDSVKEKILLGATDKLMRFFKCYLRTPFSDDHPSPEELDEMNQFLTDAVKEATPVIRGLINFSTITSLGSKHGIIQLISKATGITPGRFVSIIQHCLASNALNTLSDHWTSLFSS
jgi:hypothetical protein